MTRNFALLFLILSIGILSVRAQYTIPAEVQATGLRVMVVETVGGEEPTSESIYSPPGSLGIGSTNVNKVPGRVRILNPDGHVAYDSGEYEKKESGMTIKVRGNTSAIHEKKPFKIKLEKKADLLNRGDKNLNDKNWVLLVSSFNCHELGFIIGEMVGMAWAPAYEYVNLVINDDYRGLYLLAEGVERNEKCRIRTEETGFITERDPYWWNEDGEYLPSKWNPRFNWTMKYPDFEDLTEEQTAYIHGVVSEFERIISTKDYADLIDVDSFCRWLIAQDILGTSDGGGTNFFLAKNDDTPDSRLYVPVLWDVDSSMGKEGNWSNVHGESMIEPLWKNSDRSLVKRYAEIYREVSPKIYERMDEIIADLRTEAWAGFNKASELDIRRWGESPATYRSSERNAADMKWWFGPRRLWLDAEVAKLEAETSIGAIEAEEGDCSMSVFSLDGRIIYSGNSEGFAAPQPGIYIIRQGRETRKVVF